jgi:hypothetical protein
MTQLLVRIEDSTKKTLTSIAHREGKNASEVIRSLINGYIRDRDIGAYIDDLWDRMGKEARANGHTVDDIPRIIREVRKAAP